MDVPSSRRSPGQPSLEHGKRVAHRRTLVLGLGMILSLVGAGCGSGGRLGAEALLRQSKSLLSQAAEGAILAQDAVSGDTTRIYTREHASDLATAASEIEASLNEATTEPALEPTLRKLEVLAGRIGTDLERIGTASEDEERMLIGELQEAAEASQRIGEGLM